MLAAAPCATAPRAGARSTIPATTADLPIRYSAMPLGREGRVLALGRDLRPVSSCSSGSSTPRRSSSANMPGCGAIETRYQTLFQLSAEAVIIARRRHDEDR